MSDRELVTAVIAQELRDRLAGLGAGELAQIAVEVGDRVLAVLDKPCQQCGERRW